jgi:hypothetical protein
VVVWRSGASRGVVCGRWCGVDVVAGRVAGLPCDVPEERGDEQEEEADDDYWFSAALFSGESVPQEVEANGCIHRGEEQCLDHCGRVADDPAAVTGRAGSVVFGVGVPPLVVFALGVPELGQEVRDGVWGPVHDVFGGAVRGDAEP